MISDRLTVAMGRPFIAENKPGAGGTIGTEFVAKAPPDGYTLVLSTAATPITASAYHNLKYDTAAFTSVVVLAHSPLGFAANPNFPPKTVREFIDYAKANPGKVNFGSLGVVTSHHLTGEKLKLDAGIDMVHVPYKGSGAAHARRAAAACLCVRYACSAIGGAGILRGCWGCRRSDCAPAGCAPRKRPTGKCCGDKRATVSCNANVTRQEYL